jgi:tRNA(Ile)-lysidine synthase TilS/MesJ
MKKIPKRIPTVISRNISVIGDSIEVTMERLMNGEGLDNIEDRDLVYNDNEASIVNPLTNIRSDKWELMLEEKIGEYEYKHRKTPTVEKTENEETVEEAA